MITLVWLGVIAVVVVGVVLVVRQSQGRLPNQGDRAVSANTAKSFYNLYENNLQLVYANEKY